MTSIEVRGSDAGGVDFDVFFQRTEPRLRRALMAAYGPDDGREATPEALAWAWEHRDRLQGLTDPVSYLYRVGQTRSRRRKTRLFHSRDVWVEPWIEPALTGALFKLSEHQRVVVVLVHGYAWTHREVADLLGLKVTTVQSHLDRGLARLRSQLKVAPDD